MRKIKVKKDDKVKYFGCDDTIFKKKKKKDMLMDYPIIELKNITKKFGDKVILDNISLTIPENKIYGVIGPSGSGKTTLLNMIIGYLKANRGTINYKGQNIKTIKNLMKNKYGFASQAHSFYNKLSVKENIEYFGKMYGLDFATIDERRDVLLDVMQLREDQNKLGEELSSGMKKRLDIACSLIHDPEVLILDEPTADLDTVLRSEILNLLKKIKESGTTIIITSHLLQEVEQLCDNIVLIHNKKAIDIHPGFEKNKELTIKFKSGEYTNFLKTLNDTQLQIKNATNENGQLKILTDSPDSILQVALSHSSKNNDQIEYLNIGNFDLERIFLNRVKK